MRNKQQARQQSREQRRQKREAQGNRASGVTTHKLKKEVPLPNLYPYKRAILSRASGGAVPTRAELTHQENLRAAAGIAAAQQAAQQAIQSELQRAALSGQGPDPSLFYQPLGAAEAGADFVNEDALYGRGYDESRDAYNPQERVTKRGAFRAELDEVLKRADVVLEVVDARDPLNTRCKEIEDRCTAHGKPFIVVLNKIDLLPVEVAKTWLAFFRASRVPACIFKAAQRVKDGVRQVALLRPGLQVPGEGDATDEAGAVGAVGAASGAAPGVASGAATIAGPEALAVADSLSASSATIIQRAMTDASAAVGVAELKQAIHGCCRGAKRVQAAVVGLPNAGKSSLINSLAGGVVVKATPIAGTTRSISEIRIDEHLTLLDSPGVALASGPTVILNDQSTDITAEVSRLILMMQDYRDVFRAFKLEDRAAQLAQQEPAVAAAFAAADTVLASARAQSAAGMDIQEVFSSGQNGELADCISRVTEILLRVFCRARGMVKKGGVPQFDLAATTIVRDWNRGVVPFYRAPPAREQIQAEVQRYQTQIAGIQALAAAEQGTTDAVVSQLAPEFDVDALLAGTMEALGESTSKRSYVPLR